MPEKNFPTCYAINNTCEEPVQNIIIDVSKDQFIFGKILFIVIFLIITKNILSVYIIR